MTRHFGQQAFFAWTFAAPTRAANAARAAGSIRTSTGEYTLAFLAAGAPVLVAAGPPGPKLTLRRSVESSACRAAAAGGGTWRRPSPVPMS